MPARPADSSWLDALPADATVYASLDVGRLRPLLARVLEGAGPDYADVLTLLDMTRRAYVSVRLRPPEPLGFSVVGLGSYPSFFIGLRLGTNPDWKRVNTPQGGFFQSARGLQAVVPTDTLLVASNGDAGAVLGGLYSPTPISLPPEVSADMAAADAVLYLPRLPGNSGLPGGGASGIPIREVWITLRRGEAAYSVSATVATASGSDARIFAVIFRLGLVSWLRTEKVENVAEKLKTVTIAPDGPLVRLGGLSFTEAEILPLLLSLLFPGGQGAAR